MLTLTENAKAAVDGFAARLDKEVFGLRIGVTDGGCSGMTYSMALEEAARADDVVVECGTTRVILDPLSAPKLEGVVVDFAETAGGAGFTFENPNAKACCGCGKSFS